MKNLTTPQAIFLGLTLIAVAIASTPYSHTIIKPAYASSKVQKITICEPSGFSCTKINNLGALLVSGIK